MRAVAFMLLLLCSSVVTAKASSCVPDDMKSTLSSSLPGWKLVELRDLREDDQRLLHERPSSDCPGVAVGDFQGLGRKSYAFTLFEVQGGLRQILVVFDPMVSDTKKRIIVLDGPREVAYLSVIWRIEPGENSDVNGKKFTTRSDSIMYEAIESGALLFYFSNGGYRHVQMVD